MSKRKISDFFARSDEKRAKEEMEKVEEEHQNKMLADESVDVQSLKCPRRRVLAAESAEKTNGIVVAKKTVQKPQGNRRKRGGAIKKQPKSQRILDCGQSVIGATTCPDCKMMYSVDDAGDVNHHWKFHDEFLGRLEIPKNFIDVISDFHVHDNEQFKVFYLAGFLEEPFKNMLTKHVKVINGHLGYKGAGDENLFGLGKRIFFVLMTVFEEVPERKMYIGGILIAEKITQAFTNRSKKIITDESDVNDWIVGVDRIWVSAECRRQGVAMALLDAATTMDRQMEHRARRLRIAWSDPSDEGKLLAKKFQKTRYSPEHGFKGEILLY